MADKLPGKGVFGWLGRQVGYVKKAVTTKPAAAPAKRSAPQSAPPPSAAPDPPAEDLPPAVLYRHDEVHEAEHPAQPGVKLRRTIIDEVIVEPDPDEDGRPP